MTIPENNPFQGIDIQYLDDEETEDEKGLQQRSSLEDIDIQFEQPETGLSRKAQQFGLGVAEGTGGLYGDIIDLAGRAAFGVYNYITGSNIDYDKGRQDLKESISESDKARFSSQYQALENLSGDQTERSWTEVMGDIMSVTGDDDLALYPFLPPTTTEIEEKVTEAVPETAPRTEGERQVRTGGQFVGPPLGTVSKLGKTKALKGMMQEAGKELAKESAQGLAAGAVLEQALEEGSGPVSSFLLSMGAGLAARGGVSGAARTGEFIAKVPERGLARSAAELAQAPKKVLKNLGFGASPQEAKQTQNEIVRIAKQEGIELPASAVADNNIIQLMEAKLRQSGLAGTALEEQRARIVNQFAKRVNAVVDEISTENFSNNYMLGTALKEGLNESQELAQQTYSNLYNQAEQQFAGTPQKFAPTNLVKETNDLIKSLEKAPVRSPKTQTALNRLEEFREAFTVNGKPKETSIQDLIAQKQELNQILDFEALGGNIKRINSLSGAIRQDIQNFKNVNPEGIRIFNEAERVFGESAETFRKNPLIRNALNTSVPENIPESLKKTSKQNELQSALRYLPQEQRETLMNKSRATALRDTLNKAILDPSEKISPAKLRTFLGKKQNRDLINTIANANVSDRLIGLQKVADQIEKGFSKFFNPSQSGATVIDAFALYSIVDNAIKAMTTMNPAYLVQSGVSYVAPRVLSNLITDPAFIDELIKLGQASTKDVSQWKASLGSVAGKLAQKIQEAEADTEAGKGDVGEKISNIANDEY